MSRKTLNLGILAHVDAGKTTLTERLLYAAGVIDSVGSVDRGTTQTDWLPLERERGITIKSAVASFAMEGITVNLIDTPGHPDFIAEVERVLGVLDGTVLVVSAVEGVQPQTRLLMRVLKRLKIPTLIFVNKIDLMGASAQGTLDSISRRLTTAAIPLGSVSDAGSRQAGFQPFDKDDAAFLEEATSVLAEHNSTVLDLLDSDQPTAARRLERELARQTRACLVHPLLFGSALTGTGTGPLMKAIAQLLPWRTGDPNGVLEGAVFKIERSRTREKLVYLWLSSGTLRVRQRVSFANGVEEKATKIAVFQEGSITDRAGLQAGQIGKVSGMKAVRIGDVIGRSHPDAGTPEPAAQFARPTLAASVVPTNQGDGQRLLAALSDLAEQDPLIDVRHNPRAGEISVSLYGEVQEEVIQATLQREYGLGAEFRAVTPLYVERPAGCGEAAEILNAPTNPFFAAIGFRVEPAAPGSGIEFRLAVDPPDAPLYIYKTLGNFAYHVETWVGEVLKEGLKGWEVTDCTITLNHCLYSLNDGPPSRRGPLSSPGDFRYLTPIVLMEALQRAGTVVCEPLVRMTMEVPAQSVQGVLTALGRLGAAIEAVVAQGELSVLRANLSSEAAAELQRILPEMTGGEGVLESTFSGYRPCRGQDPTRERTTVDPLDRQAYLAALGRHL